MTDNESLDFSRLMAESSLGSQGARELISRSDPTEVSRVLETARRIEARDRSLRDAHPDNRHRAKGDFATQVSSTVTFGGDLASPDNECAIVRPKRQSSEQDRLDRGGSSGFAWLFESFGGLTACTASGITMELLARWIATGIVELSSNQGTYSFRDILSLSVTKRLLDAGISPQQAQPAVRSLGECNTDELRRVTLISDGAWVRVCTSSAEVVDLLQGRQGVFGIALGGVWRDVVAKLSRPPEQNTSERTAMRDPLKDLAGDKVLADEIVVDMGVAKFTSQSSGFVKLADKEGVDKPADKGFGFTSRKEGVDKLADKGFGFTSRTDESPIEELSPNWSHDGSDAGGARDRCR